jgi:hypothetical protein
MKLFAESAKRICLTATLVVAVPGVAQERTFTRHFVASIEERYQVTLNVKAESHSVTTETVAAQTYVTPLLHMAELNLRWGAVRSILAVNDDGSAAIQETLTPARQQCEEVPQDSDKTDPALQLSLKKFCTLWLKMEIIGYTESDRGVLKAASASEDALPPLAEAAPQLLSLWLKRAVRPSVILPQLYFEVGATSRQSFHPAANILKNARGSESVEWNDAQGETPAVTLHVVQQLLWNAPPASETTDSEARQSHTQRDESFFADSLSTLSILDGSLLRANRSASRTSTRHVDPVPGLSQPPDFSSKLTLAITIERLP